jgi:type II secretory pathway component GspD/PulD (secretin)
VIRVSTATPVTAVFILLLSQEIAGGQEVKSQRYVSMPLVHIDAVIAAKKVTVILGSEVQIVADKQSNAVFLRGSADNVEKAQKILKRLDVRSELYVIRLKNADAGRTANKLGVVLLLLALLGDDREARVMADARSGSILIIASEEKGEEVKEMVRRLDVKPKQPGHRRQPD